MTAWRSPLLRWSPSRNGRLLGSGIVFIAPQLILLIRHASISALDLTSCQFLSTHSKWLSLPMWSGRDKAAFCHSDKHGGFRSFTWMSHYSYLRLGMSSLFITICHLNDLHLVLSIMSSELYLYNFSPKLPAYDTLVTWDSFIGEQISMRIKWNLSFPHSL